MDNKIKNLNSIIKKCSIVLFAAIILTWALFNLTIVNSIFEFISKIITPFVVGTIIALFLNIPMSFFERKLSKTKLKWKKFISMFLAILCVLLIIFLAFQLILPEIVKIIGILIDNMPIYQEKATQFITDLSQTWPDINIDNILNLIESNSDNINNALLSNLPNIVATSVLAIVNTFSSLITFVLGLSFAFIVLGEKEKIYNGFKKLLTVYAKPKISTKIIQFVDLFVNSFNKFIVAQCICGVILGVITMIISLIFQISYGFQIGYLIGITSLIPIIGIFIGLAISALLLISVAPIKAIIFLITIFVIWLLCESFVKPVITGKRVGISNFWLFVATIAGSAAFGIPGIIFSVPIFMALHTMISEDIKNKSEIMNKSEN